VKKGITFGIFVLVYLAYILLFYYTDQSFIIILRHNFNRENFRPVYIHNRTLFFGGSAQQSGTLRKEVSLSYNAYCNTNIGFTLSYDVFKMYLFRSGSY
jgi:hypothetical protein